MTHLSDTEIFEFVENISSEAERARIAGHIADCAQCREKAVFESALKSALSQQKIISPSANFSSRVMARVVFSRDEATVLRERRNKKLGLAAAVAACVGLFILLLVLMPGIVIETGYSSPSVSISVKTEAVQKLNRAVAETSGTIFDFSSRLGLTPLLLIGVFAALYSLDRAFSKKFFRRGA